MKRLASILGILILMFGTSDWLVKQHFCEEEMVSFSFFSSPEPCVHAQEVVTHACCSAKKKVVVPKKCCSEKVVHLKAIDVVSFTAIHQLNFNLDLLLNTWKGVEVTVQKFFLPSFVSTQSKPPPRPLGRILAQLQSYLI